MDQLCISNQVWEESDVLTASPTLYCLTKSFRVFDRGFISVPCTTSVLFLSRSLLFSYLVPIFAWYFLRTLVRKAGVGGFTFLPFFCTLPRRSSLFLYIRNDSVFKA